jgi:hypothetical protein
MDEDLDFYYGNEIKNMKCEKIEDWSNTFQRRVYRWTNELKKKLHPA